MSGNLEEPFVLSKNFQVPAFKEGNINMNHQTDKHINSFENKLANKVD